jgi:hypothetical protein
MFLLGSVTPMLDNQFVYHFFQVLCERVLFLPRRPRQWQGMQAGKFFFFFGPPARSGCAKVRPMLGPWPSVPSSYIMLKISLNLRNPRGSWQIMSDAWTLIVLSTAGLAWPGGQAWGLDFGLSPKTRPVKARAFGLCSKSPSPHVGPGPNPALWLSSYIYFEFAGKRKANREGTYITITNCKLNMIITLFLRKSTIFLQKINLELEIAEKKRS